MNVYNIHCKVIRIQVQMRLRQFSVLKPESGETLTNHTRNAQTINQYDIDDIIVLSLHKKNFSPFCLGHWRIYSRAIFVCA